MKRSGSFLNSRNWEIGEFFLHAIAMVGFCDNKLLGAPDADSFFAAISRLYSSVLLPGKLTPELFSVLPHFVDRSMVVQLATTASGD